MSGATTIADLQAQMDRLAEIEDLDDEELRRTVICRPEDEARIWEAVNRAARPDLIEIIPNATIAEGQIYVLNPSALGLTF